MMVKWTDRKIEEILGEWLRIGVSVSAFVVLCGGIIYLIRHGFSPADYRTFQGEPNEFRSLRGVIGAVREGRGHGIIQLGLLILIVTPIMRVAFSFVGFAFERDRMYLIFTAIVLTILLYSVVGNAH